MSHRGRVVRNSSRIAVLGLFATLGAAIAASCAGSDSVESTTTGTGTGGASTSSTGTVVGSGTTSSSSGKGGASASTGTAGEAQGGAATGGAGGAGGASSSSSSASSSSTGGQDGGPDGCSSKPEVCNGLDDNCNGQIDEGDPGGGASCTANAFGECAKGTLHCVNGAVKCVPGTPKPEICDGLDNNCDGNIDEGNPGGGMQCSTGLLGICASGITTCKGTMGVVCQPTATPGQIAESCNGLDDDCDGVIDDNISQVGQACVDSNYVGICQFGTYVCPKTAPFQLTCQHPLPGTIQETCNGKDDDCNGLIDDGLNGQPCATGLPGVCSTGTTQCVGGSMTCNPTIAPGSQSEVCDNKDNNCDGTVDNISNVTATCQSQLPSAQFVQAWACTTGNCVIQACQSGHADINGAPADGCECATDSYATQCSTAGTTSVPKGGTATMVGVVETAAGSDWMTFSFTVPPVGQEYHPKIQLTDSGGGQYAMDVQNDCTSLVSCNDGGGGSKLTVWEQSYGPTYIPGAGCCSDQTARIASVKVRVYRALGNAPTCQPYTVTASNL